MARYPLLYADPAVAYGDKGGPGRGKGAGQLYPTMRPIDNVMEIDRLALPVATLFCWKTLPTMHEFWPLMAATGWRRRTTGFVWVKTTSAGNLHSGPGSWTGSNVELCDIYTRGKNYLRPENPLKVHQLIVAPVGEHSAKPPITRDKIVQLMGEGLPKVELFARERVEGWDAHGLEVDERLEGYA